jgi:hypothetical protein
VVRARGHGHRRNGLWCALFLASISCARAETLLPIDLPVNVTFSDADGKATWAVATPDLSQVVPALNAGDRLRILDVRLEKAELGKWLWTFRRFSHRSCRSGFFRKKCTDHYANDDLTVIKAFDPLSSDVNLRLEFVNALPPHASWKPGKHPVREWLLQWVSALGPLEMKIVGGVSAKQPVAADFKPAPGSTPIGAMRQGEILGKGGSQQWLTIKVEFEAAQLVE